MYNFWRQLLLCITFVLLFAISNAFAEGAPSIVINNSEVTKISNYENFLTLADIHLDPFLSCKTKSCPLIEKLRKAPISQWEQIFSSNDNSSPRYGDDTNYSLFISTLASAKKMAATEHVKYVIILGDLLAHDYKAKYQRYSNDKSGNGYRQFVLKTYQFIVSELKKAFPTTDVYPILGNNDSYGGDYVSNKDGQFFKDMAKTFAPLVLTPTNRRLLLNEFPQGGYYSVVLSQKLNLRLIALNSNFFSYKAQGKTVEKSAVAQLNWLHQQLQAAKDQNQKVFIAMHIPAGIDVYASLRLKLFTLMELWKTQYLTSFQNEVKSYAGQIDAILAAHLHSDWFQILTFEQDEIPVTGTSSVSPIFGNNPGFKIYHYSIDTRELQDFATYYYPLGSQVAWTKEYDFNHVYQANCPDCPIIKGMKSLEESGKLSEHYKSFYSVGTSSQPIIDKWYPYYWCAIRELDAKGYKECVR